MSRILLLAMTIAFLQFPFSLHADAASEVRAVLELSEEAWNQKEMDEIAAQYHKDFVLISDNGVIPRAQQLSDIREILEDKDPGKLEHSDIVVKVLSDDHAVVYSGHGPATTIGAERRSNPFLRG